MNRFLPLIRGIDGIDRVYIGQILRDEMEFMTNSSSYWIITHGLSKQDYDEIYDEFKKVNSQISSNTTSNYLTFKPGDKVICTKIPNYTRNYTLGKEYEVGGRYHSQGSKIGIVENDNGDNDGISGSYAVDFDFQLNSQPTNYSGTITFNSAPLPQFIEFPSYSSLFGDSYKSRKDPKPTKTDSHKCDFKLYTGLFEQYDMCFECGKKK